jgi:hypothetical protein
VANKRPVDNGRAPRPLWMSPRGRGIRPRWAPDRRCARRGLWITPLAVSGVLPRLDATGTGCESPRLHRGGERSMPYLTSSRRAVAVATLAVLAAAGCTGADGSTQSPTTGAGNGTTAASESPTPSDSRSPSQASTTRSGTAAPTVAVPAAARQHTEAGAVAFATYFAMQASDVYRTADSTTVEALSDQECKPCDALTLQADSLRQLGQRATIRAFTASQAAARPSTSPGIWTVDVMGTERDTTFVDDKGVTKRSVAGAGRVTFRVQLKWHGNAWSVTDLAIVKS